MTITVYKSVTMTKACKHIWTKWKAIILTGGWSIPVIVERHCRKCGLKELDGDL